MKVTAVDTCVLTVPTSKPMALQYPQHKLVVAQISTDQGLRGLGQLGSARNAGSSLLPGGVCAQAARSKTADAMRTWTFMRSSQSHPL